MPTLSRSGSKSKSKSKSSRDKVRVHRARLRKEGLRQIQIWIPDVRSKAFAREAHRQALAVANSAHAQEDQAFIDAISVWDAE
jgi:antidote-toxin recognition MazE-like antitoxin